MNWIDLATKVHDAKRMGECLRECGFRIVDGQAGLALKAAM